MKPKRQISEATREKNRQRAAAWRAANPEQARAGVKKWLEDPANLERKRELSRQYHHANKEEKNAYRREWTKNHKEHTREYHIRRHAENPRLRPDQHLRKTYGITLEDYERMHAEQGGVCAICKKDAPGGRGKRFHVDHDHQTGAVRGLLCHQCNVSLGAFEENVDVMRAAVDYILKYRAEATRTSLAPAPAAP